MDTLELVVVHKKRDLELYDYIEGIVNEMNVANDGISDEARFRLFRVNEKNWDNLLKANKVKMFDKIMLIGDFEGAPLLEASFDRFGARFGYDSKYMVISIDNAYDWDSYEYNEFLEELGEHIDIDLVHMNGFQTKEKTVADRKKDMLMVAGGFLFPPLHIYELGKKAIDTKDTIKDNDIVRKQMLLYGLVMMNKMCFEDFLKD